ncbi:hypothetical protein C8R48DRAFT_614560, partial [Suillus tomentosus]
SLRLRPPSHYRGSECLYNLSIALHDRIKQRGSLSDIGEATELYRAASLPIPTGHSHRSIAFDSLAVSLRDRFEQFKHRGDPSDLDEAIELHWDALLHFLPTHSYLSSFMNNLTDSLRDRLQQWGVLSDLNESIELHQAASLLHPLPDRSMSFNNLSAGFRDRPPQQYVPSDIDELGGAALLLRPLGHPDRCVSRQSCHRPSN